MSNLCVQRGKGVAGQGSGHSVDEIHESTIEKKLTMLLSLLLSDTGGVMMGRRFGFVPISTRRRTVSLMVVVKEGVSKEQGMHGQCPASGV